MKLKAMVVDDNFAVCLQSLGWCWIYSDSSSIGDSGFDFVGKACTRQEHTMLNELYDIKNNA